MQKVRKLKSIVQYCDMYYLRKNNYVWSFIKMYAILKDIKYTAVCQHKLCQCTSILHSHHTKSYFLIFKNISFTLHFYWIFLWKIQHWTESEINLRKAVCVLVCLLRNNWVLEWSRQNLSLGRCSSVSYTHLFYTMIKKRNSKKILLSSEELKRNFPFDQ